MNQPKYANDQIARLLRSEQTSDWLRRALSELLSRDILDAKNDADTLAQVMNERVRDEMGDGLFRVRGGV